jgi:hypothetical protein
MPIPLWVAGAAVERLGMMLGIVMAISFERLAL